ncbi:MAG: TatD family deoxyribonuclease [Asgard group archaeon]|nr:TatD family deoxyribonuclease [Asgard group archaeon]
MRCTGVKFIDSHCHLADNVFFKKLPELIPDWRSKGIIKVGAMATNMKTTKRILELHKVYPNFIVPSIGRHPWGAHKVSQDELQIIEQLITENKSAVIGEIGLDHYFVKEKDKQEKQLPLFKFFLELAQKYKRPIMLHVTGAEKNIFEILSTFKLESKICCHWYSGPEGILKKLRDIGCYFTINPSFQASKNHRKVLENVNLNHLLTESDGPVKFQGKTNSPTIIPSLVTKIATKLEINESKLESIIYQNYLDFLQD